MNDKQIDAMLSDIIQHADYDLWKGFYSRHPEDPEMAEDTRAELREVARRHLEKEKGLSGSKAATLLGAPKSALLPGEAVDFKAAGREVRKRKTR